jgi:uncharacterized phage protein (TIGR02218 family)
MSFAEFETSLQNARPLRLYQFQRGHLKWGFTSADRNIIHAGITFRTLEGGISDDGIRQTEDAQSDMLTLTLPSSTDIAQMYRQYAPSQTVQLTIFDRHFGDDGYLVVWIGNVAGVKFRDEVTAQIQCQTLSASLERTGLRKTWSRSCSHQLYDKSCRVLRASFQVTAVITALDGMTVRVAEAASKTDHWFSGGYVSWMGKYGHEMRGIESHIKNELVLYGGTGGLAEGTEITIYAGCDRLFSTCKTKFNNHANYGGCPHMPGKSPFDGTPVF